MKIAVVGSGISGLSSSYYLSKKHKVDLFEKQDRFGGHSYGHAFKFEYVLLVPVKGKEMKITFDDWIFKQNDRVAINRATMTKFGIKVAELTVVFVKD